MRRWLFLPFAVALVGLTVSAAFAAPLVSRTTLSIHRRPGGQVRAGDTITIAGKLAGRARCRAGQRISLIEIGVGAIATTITDASGSYSFSTGISATTSFQTKFDGATVGTHPNERLCAASVSPVLRVPVASVLGAGGSTGPTAPTGSNAGALVGAIVVLLGLGLATLAVTRRRVASPPRRAQPHSVSDRR